MIELKPCPFCGGNDIQIDEMESFWDKNETIWRVLCINCIAETAGDTKEQAIAAWNRRSDAVPVVRGEWVEAKSGVMSVWPPGQMMCSACGQRMPSQWKKMPPYCYGCGAKMGGKP